MSTLVRVPELMVALSLYVSAATHVQGRVVPEQWTLGSCII